jgi:hypothetical protein
MCGIAGWISYDRDLTAHQDIIAAMMKKMLRRGPDAGGIWIESNSASKPVFVSPSRHHRAQRRSRTGVGSHRSGGSTALDRPPGMVHEAAWRHCFREASQKGT